MTKAGSDWLEGHKEQGRGNEADAGQVWREQWAEDTRETEQTENQKPRKQVHNPKYKQAKPTQSVLVSTHLFPAPSFLQLVFKSCFFCLDFLTFHLLFIKFHQVCSV